MVRKTLNTQVFRFLVVGFSAFLIDYGTLFILIEVFKFNLELFNFILVANIISTVIAVLFGFYFQKKWTFKTINSEKAKMEFVLFIALQVFNILFYNALLFNIFRYNLSLDALIAKPLVVVFQTITSYMAMKFIIFKTDTKVSN